MSYDFIEDTARRTLEYEAEVTYEWTQGRRPKPVFPGGKKLGLRNILRSHPAAAWHALKAAQEDTGDEELKCAAETTSILWRDGYPDSAGPPMAESLAPLMKAKRGPLPLRQLPFGTWRFECELTLVKDFFSKDELAFGMTENLMRRSRALGEFSVAGSGWKGALRSAFRAVHGPDTVEDLRLFGTPKRLDEKEDVAANPQDEEASARGRLVFSPSYIQATKETARLRVINPHARIEKVGRNPILYEVVKAGAACRFQLVYVPWNWTDLTRRQRGDDVSGDLRRLSPALLAMFHDLGAGGKTTAGFGTFRIGKGSLDTSDSHDDFENAAKMGAALVKLAGRFGKEAGDGA